MSTRWQGTGWPPPGGNSGFRPGSGFARRTDNRCTVAARFFGLSRAESRVAASLAEGRSVSDMARAFNRTEGGVRWTLKQIYRKLGISRQSDLVRLVLTASDLVRETADALERSEHAVRWLLRRIFRKLGITRQVALVQLVLQASRPSQS